MYAVLKYDYIHNTGDEYLDGKNDWRAQMRSLKK
jgi:hypothetical protein